MSHKVPKPSLTGQRLKTRKRDEKEKYEPNVFRDVIVSSLNACEDLDKAYKYLDSAGSKLDYHRYGETLFDILMTGALIAPGGSLILDPNIGTCKFSLFEYPVEDEQFKAFAQMFNKFIRRYKYMEKTCEDDTKKLLIFLKGFDEGQRKKLAKFIGILLSTNVISAKIIETLFQDHLTKDGLSLEFAKDLFISWIDGNPKNIGGLTMALKKNNLDDKLLNLLPLNKRSAAYLEEQFKLAGLESLITLHRAQVNDDAKKIFRTQLKRLLMKSEEDQHMVDGQDGEQLTGRDRTLSGEGSEKEDGELVKQNGASLASSPNSSFDKMIKKLLDLQKSSGFNDSQVIVLIWNTLMNMVEWNKKEDLVMEQSLKHLRGHLKLLQTFVQGSPTTELTLLNRIQDFCYDNMNFIKVFQKFVITLYKSDIISEETIVDWYNRSHSSKGKTIFREQMKPFVEWLHNAEEESSEDDEDEGNSLKLVKDTLASHSPLPNGGTLTPDSLNIDLASDAIREISLGNGAAA